MHFLGLKLVLGFTLGLMVAMPAISEEATCKFNTDEVSLGSQFFPEGITATSDNTIYIGSFVQQKISRVSNCADKAEDFITNVGPNVIGILADESRDLLFACTSDIMGTPPAIRVFSLKDGSDVATHDMGSGFCNDLTQDHKGNLYATDSFGQRIVRVKAKNLRCSGTAETWAESPEWGQTSDPNIGPWGPNGIVYSKRAIWMVTSNEGELFRIRIRRNGSAGKPRKIEIPAGESLVGADGLEVDYNHRLLVTQGGAANRVVRITVKRKNSSCETVVDNLDSPTTSVVVQGKLWTTVSQFDKLFGGLPGDDPFTIVASTILKKKMMKKKMMKKMKMMMNRR